MHTIRGNVMKLDDLFENNVYGIGFHKPKDNQMGSNKPNSFKFKVGDTVSNKELPGLNGKISQLLFFHETDNIGYVPSQNKKGGYQEYIDHIKQTKDDPYSPWYKIKWTNFAELERERHSKVGVEPEDVLTKLDNNTDNLHRLR
jgi:hypothetical protein